MLLGPYEGKEKATEKAFDLIKMAVARSKLLEQVEDQQLPMIQSTLVVGGGVAGMAAALNIRHKDSRLIYWKRRTS